MKDESVLVAKPDIHLKPPEFLTTLHQSDRPVSVEWKDDGSLANVAIHNFRAVCRSHRPEGESYYDKLPAIEDLRNRSPVWLARRLFPGPEQEGTVLRGELHHSDGAARVGGILNALPEKSIRIQQERGPVEFYAWDIAKFKGRNVSQMPYGQRRELYEGVIAEIRLFNSHLHVVPAMPEDGDPVEFYRAIINDPRGLPWSEGVVVKYRDSVDQWFKVKANDTIDVRVIRCIEGTGKFAGSLGAMVVEGPTGVESEIGSFQLTNEQRRWIWQHRDLLTGQIAEVRAMTVNESGAVRAGVFVRFHPSKSEQGLLLYSESLAGSTDPNESRPMMYRLKTSAGWRR
jgi:ATP-dependent DNA ligase